MSYDRNVTSNPSEYLSCISTMVFRGVLSHGIMTEPNELCDMKSSVSVNIRAELQKANKHNATQWPEPEVCIHVYVHVQLLLLLGALWI